MDISRSIFVPAPDIIHDKDVNIQSFNIDSNNVYVINLYNLTCTCRNFVNKRTIYPKGDIRRFCKHLMYEYKKITDIERFSNPAKFIFINGWPVNELIFQFKIEGHQGEVTVFFSLTDEWWDVYMYDKKGAFNRYGYSALGKRFSYNEKPIGLVVPLRKKLDELQREIKKFKVDQQITVKDCLKLIVLIIIIYLWYHLK